MKTQKSINIRLIGGLLLASLALAAGNASAESYTLCAKAGEKEVPANSGNLVPVWGYAEDVAGDGCANDAIQVPGPTLVSTDGSLSITLVNELPEPTSIVIPGLPMPTSGGAGPTWSDGTAGPRGTDLSKRVRSFGAESVAGTPETYTWTGIRPGTFIYHSGTWPQKQVYMGLYGAAHHDFGANEAYEGVPYDSDVQLYYSEIDPYLNQSIRCLYETDITICPDDPADPNYVPDYSTSIEYHPTWFLVNGEPYVDGVTLDLAGGTAGARTLVRFLSTAGETHVAVLQGLYMDIQAEDGFPYNFQTYDEVAANWVITPSPRRQFSAMLPPLKTKDAIIEGAFGRFAIYDGNGYLTNPSDPENFAEGDTVGGMLRFISFADADSDGDTVLDSADLCPATPAGEIVDANGCSASQLADDDGDGVQNFADLCPGTPAGEAVDANGCSASQLDDDGDGVSNAFDLCPATPAGEVVDANGCSAAQSGDADGDGVADAADLCPATPPGEAVDANGCSATQLDDDADGVNNALDLCPATPAGEAVDANGCSQTQLDDDGDGVSNALDLCPNTAAGDPVDAVGCSATQNAPPVAQADAYIMNEDAILNVSAANGVLSNDSDPNGTPLTLTLLTNVANGVLTLNPDGSFSYDSAPNFFGTDGFTYRVSDGALTADAAVTITVNSMNDSPVANADTIYVQSMTAQSVAAPGVLGNDADVDLLPFDPSQLTAVLDADVADGALTLNADGSLTYLPNVGNVAAGVLDTFDYHANDGAANSNTVTATLIRQLSAVEVICERQVNGNCNWRISGNKATGTSGSQVRVEAWVGGFDSGNQNRVRTGPNAVDGAWTITADNSSWNTILQPIDMRVTGTGTALLFQVMPIEQ